MAGATTQAERQAQVLAAGYNGPLTDAAINQAYANAATSSDLAQSGISNTRQVSSPGTVAGPGLVAAPGSNAGDVQKLFNAINQQNAALAAGNREALNEYIREFNEQFGFNKEQFAETVRQYNANLGVTQAGLTGTYQGQPTQQALNQQANFLGTYQGQPTLQAQNQAFNQQLAAIQAASGLQANPFRQAQVIGQLGGLLRGGGVAGFQAPGAAQGQTDFSGMGNMQRIIDDIRGGPTSINSQSTQGVLDAIPTPNKLDSVNFLRSSPNTQNIVLQGMQEKYGLSPDDALAQIKNTLPQFTSPTTFGGVKR